MLKNKVPKIFLITLVLIIGICLEYCISKTYVADVYYKKARELEKKGSIEEALIFINEAVDKNPNEPTYLKERARIYIALSAGANVESVHALKNLALIDLKTAYALNPNNLVVIRNSIPLYYFLAVENSQDFTTTAKDFFSETKHRFPNDVGVYVSVAKYEKKLGWTRDYEETLAQIKNLRPDLLEWNELLR